MTKPSNPPAFPRPYSKDDYGDRPIEVPSQEGMTLRDWLAGQVIEGCIIEDRSTAPLEIQYSSTQIEHFYKYRAEHAYKMADAMLLAREKENAK